jgi:TRAP transporter TAXI family solute receptor
MMESRIRYIVVGIIWIATLTAALAWFLAGQQSRLALAAGPRSSESFRLATVIASVFNRANPNILLEVFETGGSGENVRLLQQGHVDFATIQADTRVNEEVTALASLYHDAYQLIVNDSTDIQAFADLAGHRVAIPPAGSGQNQSFWFLARHYGLTEDSVIALPMAEEAADFAMIMDQVDAVFRVRAPGNASISELVERHPMRLVPIQQAEALSLQRPTIRSGVIPVGSYRGSPPLPESDLPTVELERLLVARAGLKNEQVFSMMHTLFERYSELVAQDNLAGFIRAIDDNERISIPLHPGARRYYDKEKPGLVQENTRLLASLLYVVAILTSAGFAMRSRFMRRRKVRVGDYNKQLMAIAEKARETTSPELLYELRDRLVTMLQHIVRDLDQDRVSQEEFEHFSFTWQAVDTVVRDRLSLAQSLAEADRIMAAEKRA